MRRYFAHTVAIVTLACVVFAGADWPQFRGAASNSVAVDAVNLSGSDIPVAWSAALPGRGPSSPIVVGNRIFLTASSGTKQDRLHVLGFDATSGRPLWERQFWATGRTLSHPSSANAAPTPASDGKRIFAFYSSNDLACLDLDGNLLWFRGLAHDFPRVGNDAGMSSSPVVLGDTVIVQVENQGDSFAAGLDVANGETRWRIERDPMSAWASPIAMVGKRPDESIVLLQNMRKITAHDPRTGKVLWEHQAPCDGISSATAMDGIVYVPSSGIAALDPKPGDSAPTILWKSAQIQPGAASPIVHGQRLYAINRGGVLLVGDVADGAILSKTRLTGSFWSTPTLVGNRLYAFSHEGLAQVVQISEDGRSAEVVATQQLIDSNQGARSAGDAPAEVFQSSPAVAQGGIFIRTDKRLLRLGKPGA